MTERIEVFQVTTPAGTAQASPLTTNLSFNQGIVHKLEITVPPGPSGLLGFRMRHSGQVVIPNSGTNFIIADNQFIQWDLEGYPVGNKWSIQTFNTDVFDHTLYLRFMINETRRNLLAGATLVPIAPGGYAEDLS